MLIRSSSGFAQFLVIIGLTAVSGVLAITLMSQQASGRSGAALERLVGGQAGVEAVGAALVRGPDLLEADGVVVNGQRAALALMPEGGKLSLRAAPVEALAAYAAYRGATAIEVDAMLAALADARVSGDLVGMEAAVEQALLPHVSGDALAEDISRVSLVPTVDPALASEAVLAAIPGLSAADRQSILSARAAGQDVPGGLSPHFGNPQPYYTLAVRLDWGDDARFERRIPLEYTNGGQALILAAPRP